MRYKLIKDGTQVNIIESSEAFVTDYCSAHGLSYAEDANPPDLDAATTPLTLESLSAQLDATQSVLDALLMGNITI